ncbi:hypothetical protein SKAU_G00421850 [Synaphobranchus kaupii]|uniref:Uncharacterized protein n=1 Tax=Synaphobranchus kaupii TaxID=118154 RepID=A0A9Q1E6R6_SYNKA|nr:hypothetical protein SKAU_G00421850 [Synaphobranchus kaupii]
MQGMCGGAGAPQDATPEVQDICDEVHVGGDEHVHLRVFRPLPHTNKPLELHSLQTDKAAHEPIGYF